MKPIKNTFLIKADIHSETTLNIKGLNGESLVINKRFNPLQHTIQYGEIIEVPLSFDENSIDSRYLKIGDKIFFHYLICQEENRVIINGQELFFCNYDQIWAKIEKEKLIPIDKVLFAEHIIDDKLQSDSGLILKPYETNVAYKLRIFAINEFIHLQGINIGDTIITIKGAGIPIKDNHLVWLKLGNIIGVEHNKEVIPLEGKNIVLEDEVPDITMWRGLMVGDMHRSKFCTGKFLRGNEKIKEGENVTYIHSMFSRFELDGIKYSVIEKKDLISINNKIK